MKSFRFYIDGIDSPKEFVKSFKGKTRHDAFQKAVGKYGQWFVYYSPTPKKKRK